eukprot:250347_1
MFTLESLFWVILAFIWRNKAANLQAYAPNACGAHPRVRCDGDGGQNVLFCHICSAANLGATIRHHTYLAGQNYHYFTREQAFCPQGVPGTGVGGAGAVVVGNGPGNWVINWAAESRNGRPKPFEKESRVAHAEGLGLALRQQRPIYQYVVNRKELAGDNPCGGALVAGICRYKILATSHQVPQPPALAKQEYK